MIDFTSDNNSENDISVDCGNKEISDNLTNTKNIDDTTLGMNLVNQNNKHKNTDMINVMDK